MSEVHLPGGFKTFWTLTRFLSRSPIKETFGVVETPTTSNLLLQGQTAAGLPSPTPSATPMADAGTLNPQDATPTPRPK